MDSSDLKQKLEEKQQKQQNPRAFDSSSVHLFSSVEPLLDAVQSGMKQANSSWNAETKVFSLSPGKGYGVGEDGREEMGNIFFGHARAYYKSRKWI